MRFSLRRRLRSSWAYTLQGRVIPPAHLNIKLKQAAQLAPVPDLPRSIGIGVRPVSTPTADIG
ncbi:MAG: hypothetical protein Q6K80_10280, partial [Thermostichus sp. DG_1_6_bins_120]